MSSTYNTPFTYHQYPTPGKCGIIPTVQCRNEKDLALAYSPGVAQVCEAIKDDVALVRQYTNKANLVGIITNGTAVLGLGNIGAEASKPVMEGKSALFKMFADVDVFDLELSTTDPEQFITTVKSLEPTFGGINLEDIKAPECFYIEEELKKQMQIPVFHDDQHGTAVASGAALINAAYIAKKDISTMKIVISGAGAAGIACAKFYIALGVKLENLFLFDSKGLIHKKRTDLTPYKKALAQDSDCGSLADVLCGADMFLGLSKKGLLSSKMVSSMHEIHPIILACANPDPEISFEEAKKARPDCIMGTGRSDYPNQINNLSCFPFLFRGTLDCGATEINEAMKLAAAHAIAALAKEPIPAEVSKMHGGDISFGPDYVVPTPFDPRLLEWVAPAVAQAAMDTGVAQTPIANMESYKKHLVKRMNSAKRRISAYVESLQQDAETSI